MAANIPVLVNGAWQDTPVTEVVKNDIIWADKEMYVVTASFRKGFEQVIQTDFLSNADQPIEITVGKEWTQRQDTVRYMDTARADLVTFDDNTCMIINADIGPGGCYSPRLTPEKLEIWCSENIQRIEEAAAQKQASKPLAITPWW